MKLSRRQWLTLAAGAGASALLPIDVFARPAAAGTDDTAPVRLCLFLDADGLTDPLRRGIEAIAGAMPAIADIRLSTIDPATVPMRLDRLVEQLHQWRGHVLLGAVTAQRALVLEEALTELGAAWLSRGEHVQSSAGPSRHRLISSAVRAGQVEFERSGSVQHASPARWAEALGRNMAVRALAPWSAAPLLPVAPPASPAAPGHTAAPPSTRIVSLITRI